MIKKLAKLYKKNKNNKKLLNNIIASFVYKGMGLWLGILLLPAYITYFNNDVFLGVWFTLISVFSWILNFDLGIGNGLRNHLVKSIINDNKKEMEDYISSAYIIMGGISIISLIIGFTLIEFVDWNSLFNLPTNTAYDSTLSKSVKIIFFGIVVQFWLKLVFSILYAMEKSALPSLLTVISNSLLLIYLVMFNNSNIYESLFNLSIIYVLTVNLPLILITLITFSSWLQNVRPSIYNFKWSYAKSITALGGNFFIIQIALLCILSTNEILISWFFSPENVVEYQIYNKWFYLFVVLFSLLTQPIWSAFSKAIVEKRFLWILKVNKLFNLLAIFGIVASVVLGIFFQDLIDMWLGENYINVDFYTVLYFTSLSGLMMIINASTSVANAFNKLKCQLICLTTGIFLKIILSIMLSSFIEDWSVIVAATAISLLPLAIIQPIISRRLINNAIVHYQSSN